MAALYHPKRSALKDRETLRVLLPLVIRTVGKHCSYYRFGFRAKNLKRLPIPERGELSRDPRGKERELDRIAGLLLQNDELDAYLLWLDPERIPRFFLQRRVYKFDHHDDNHSWVLSLEESEYKELQSELTKHGLPDDLFYEVPAELER